MVYKLKNCPPETEAGFIKSTWQTTKLSEAFVYFRKIKVVQERKYNHSVAVKREIFILIKVYS